MSVQDFQKTQTSYILKVNIHCGACEQKVKKLMHKIDGVYSVSVDGEQGKVVVTGDVDPARLIKKLKRSGKHAEMWGGQRGMMMYNQNYPNNLQFQNLQVDNGNGVKYNKSQNQNQNGQQLAHFQNINGPQDFKVPTKPHKSVKFNLPVIVFDDEDNFDKGGGHGHPMHNNTMMNNMMPVMGNGHGPCGPAGIANGLYGPAGMASRPYGPAGVNGPIMNNHKGCDGGGGNYYGSGKGVDVIDMPMQMKDKCTCKGGNYNEIRSGSKGGMKCNVDHAGKNKEVDINNKKKKSEGGLLGRFLGFGNKSSKKGGAAGTNKSNNSNGKEWKKGGNDLDFFELDFDIPRKHAKMGKSGRKGSNGNVGQLDTMKHNGPMGPMNHNGPMGQMGPPMHKNGPIGQMGPPMQQNGPIGQMGNVPAMNRGGEYYQGMQPMQPPSYNHQQQQYMAMMMNQQQQQQQPNMNMYQPDMVHGKPQQSMNYMPPPPMPSHPMADPIIHVFSDENTEAYCSIM